MVLVGCRTLLARRSSPLQTYYRLRDLTRETFMTGCFVSLSVSQQLVTQLLVICDCLAVFTIVLSLQINFCEIIWFDLQLHPRDVESKINLCLFQFRCIFNKNLNGNLLILNCKNQDIIWWKSVETKTNESWLCAALQNQMIGIILNLIYSVIQMTDGWHWLLMAIIMQYRD